MDKPHKAFTRKLEYIDMFHIVAQRYPFPQRRGDQLAVGKMVDFCRKNGIKYILWIAPTKENKNAAKFDFDEQNTRFLSFSLIRLLWLSIRYPLNPMQIKLFSAFYIPKKYIGKEDALYIHTIRMSSTISCRKNRIFMGAQIDLAAEFWERASGSHGVKRIIWSLEAWLLSRWSQQKLPKYKAVFRVTEFEFERYHLPNINTNPHGYDMKRIQTKSSRQSGLRRIGFFGNMEFMPNILAAQEFLKWRHLSQLDCEFVIFGRGSEKLKADNDATFLGEVNDIDREIASLDVLVNLISIGGGFQNKTIEAWAQNVPVIGFEQAFRGLVDCSNLKIVVTDIAQLDARIDELLEAKAKPAYCEWVKQNWHQEKNLEKRFEIMRLV